MLELKVLNVILLLELYNYLAYLHNWLVWMLKWKFSCLSVCISRKFENWPPPFLINTDFIMPTRVYILEKLSIRTTVSYFLNCYIFGKKGNYSI